jgi:hypothetical protein
MNKRQGEWSSLEMLTTLAIYATLEPKNRTKLPKEVLAQAKVVLSRRSESSIQLRMANFIARDPEMASLGIKGMSGGGSHVDTLWVQNSDEDLKLDLKKLLFNLAMAAKTDL